jgi:hypothetical protein
LIRIGLISEGGIDEALLPPLLSQAARIALGMDEKDIAWAPSFLFAPNGYGEIPKHLRHLARLRSSFPSEWERIGCDLVIVVHDSRKTEIVQRDKDPKKTLTDSFVKRSKAVEFDRWNAECARKVSPFLRASQVRRRCPRGFGSLLQSFSSARPNGRGARASL